MPPINCNDGESSASESSFDREELYSKRGGVVRFDDRCNRVYWVYSFVDFRSDLWYSRAEYEEIMEDNWEIVDWKVEGGYKESKHDTYRGLEPLTQDKPCYMSAVFAVIQEQERLCRQGTYCAEKISQTSQVMSREDKRIALKHAENDCISVYGKPSRVRKSKSTKICDDKSIASTVSSSSISTLASSVTLTTSKETRKVYISPMRRVKRLLSPKKHTTTTTTLKDMPPGIPAL